MRYEDGTYEYYCVVKHRKTNLECPFGGYPKQFEDMEQAIRRARIVLKQDGVGSVKVLRIRKNNASIFYWDEDRAIVWWRNKGDNKEYHRFELA